MTTDHHDHQRFLTEAAAPETEPQRLMELVGMNDPEISATVARHPRISPEIIENLLLLFPDEVLANPASAEIDRANPEFFRRIFSQAEHLVKTGKFPPAWQNKLLQDPEPLIRSAIAANPHLDPTAIQNCLHSEDRALRQGLAENSALGLTDLEDLSYDPDSLVRLAIAKNQHLYPNALERLAQDSVATVRAAVAGNGRTAPGTLLKLAQDPDLAVRRLVAANPHSPKEALAQLGMDPDAAIAENLVNHSQSSANLLAKVAQNSAWPVKVALAGNIKTPVATLIELAELIPRTDAGDSFSLRQALAQNPNTPDFLLGRCLLPEDTPSRQEQISLLLSHHLNATDELLDSLADRDNVAILENVVNHPNLHHPTLVKLASSKSWPIQQRALQRINASPAVIDRQTYIAEAEASIGPVDIANDLIASPRPVGDSLGADPVRRSQEFSQPYEITLLSTEEAYPSVPTPSSSFMIVDTNWGEIAQTGFSQLYDRTGEHLSAMHPLALLLTMLTMLCLGMGLTLWVKSIPPDPKTILANTPASLPSSSPKSATPKINNNYNQAIYIANAATIASQSAITSEDWRRVSNQWQQAIVLLEAVPPGDPKYVDAQSRAANYKNILTASKIMLEKSK
jgi:Leucine rich repeat variant